MNLLVVATYLRPRQSVSYDILGRLYLFLLSPLDQSLYHNFCDLKNDICLLQGRTRWCRQLYCLLSSARFFPLSLLLYSHMLAFATPLWLLRVPSWPGCARLKRIILCGFSALGSANSSQDQMKVPFQCHKYTYSALQNSPQANQTPMLSHKSQSAASKRDTAQEVSAHQC